MARSFSHPTTTFEILRSETPWAVDGVALGEPTGEIVCLSCGESHLNVDEIPHTPLCAQRFVHSEWYAESMRADGGGPQ